MPFPKRIILSPQDYFPIKADAAKEDDILDSFTAARCVGIMFQLGKLAELATEMFAQLQNDVGAIHERVKAVSQRVAAIGPVLSQNYDVITKFRVSKRQEAVVTQQSFAPESRDSSIKARYNNSRPRPKFELLNTVVQEDISKKYSNPNFFFEMWVQAEQARQEEAAQAAQKRKAAKGDRKKKRQNDKGMKRVEAQKVQTKVYSAMGAEFQGSPSEFQPQGSMSNVNIQRRASGSEASSPVQSKRPSNIVTSGSTSDLTSPRQGPGPMSPNSVPAPRPSAMYNAPPIAPPMPTGGAPPPPPIPQAHQVPQAPQAPPIPMAPSIPAAPAFGMAFPAAAPPPPPIPMNIPAAPAIPMAPAIPAAPTYEEGANYAQEDQVAPQPEYEEEREPTGLLAQLKGVQLRAAAPAPPKPVDAKSSLLAQIRDVKARNLKKVEVQKKEAPTPFGLGATVASILARRAAIEGSDDESGSDGEWES